MEIAKHLIRVSAIVCMTAVFLGAVVMAMIYFHFPIVLMLFVLIGLIVPVVYFYSLWAPAWAPVSKPIARSRWQREDGTDMDTVVELAQLALEDSSFECYRVSMYESTRFKRRKCQVIGDHVTYLGTFPSGIWFYIHNRFYARRDGLVCLCTRTFEWLYLEPKSEVLLSEELNQQSSKINVTRKGEDMRLDLATLPPSECPHTS